MHWPRHPHLKLILRRNVGHVDWRDIQHHVTDLEVDRLEDPGTGVVQEREQRLIAPARPCRAVWCRDNRPHFGPRQEAERTRSRYFALVPWSAVVDKTRSFDDSPALARSPKAWTRGRLSSAAIGSQRCKVAVPNRPEDNGLTVDQDAIDRQGPHRLRDPQKGVAVIGCVTAPQGDTPASLRAINL
jgi:hypothetical protein